MDEPHEALGRVRTALLDVERLVRAVGSGRRRGVGPPDPERVELRPVQLRGGLVLQVTSRTGPRVVTTNLPVSDGRAAPGGRPAGDAVPELARRDHRGDPAAAVHQEGRRAAARGPARRRARATRATTAPGSG